MYENAGKARCHKAQKGPGRGSFCGNHRVMFNLFICLFAQQISCVPGIVLNPGDTVSGSSYSSLGGQTCAKGVHMA